MKIGFVQFAPKLGDIHTNLQKVDDLLKNVSADIIVLPELFATGYLFPDRDFLKKLAEPAGNGPIYSAMKEWAEKHNFLISGGFPEIAGDKIYNSAVAVYPDGNFVLYRKIHLFYNEKFLFEPGDIELKPFEFRGAKLGLLVCFDWIFPEVYRILMLEGTQIILHSSNLVLPYCQMASFARAIENRMFIIVANRTGTESNDGITLNFTGGSIIYSPTGEVLVQASETEDAVEIVEIDPADALDKNITEQNNLITDRRPEFYRKLCEK